MRNSKTSEQEIILINQDKNKPKKPKKDKLTFLNHSLLLKQTLISAWKSKLQLVILLLLTAFTTSLVSGSWISYQRIKQGESFLELDDANFDALLPYTAPKGGATQIANQAFSLRLGRLYYQETESSPSVAVYFDNSIIGQEIKPLSSEDFKIVYKKTDNTISGITSFEWANPNEPITFNLSNRNVKSSLWGQLMSKSENTNNALLASNYRAAADELYQNLLVNFSSSQILTSLNNYFSSWINKNSDDIELNESDDEFTSWMLNNRVNYHDDGAGDFNIPDDVNVAKDISNPNGVLAKRILTEEDENPRLAPSTDPNSFGMNGQWMTIYRKFKIQPTPSAEVLKDFSKSYSSPSEYNNVTDGHEPNIYSYNFAAASAALQNRTINVVNQFVGTAGVDKQTGQSISVKVVDIGVKRNHNNVNLKIFEGLYPSNRNEIVISPQYARKNGIKPGDYININNKDMLVSGIGGDAYNIYPIINSLDPIPNTRTEFIVYAYPDAFHSGEWFQTNAKTDISLIYFVPWKNVPVSNFDITYFDDFYQKGLFSNNKFGDRNQYDYNKYLINKYYSHDDPDYETKYTFDPSLVVTKNDSQFSLYNKGRTILDSTLNGFKYASIAGIIFLLSIVVFITYLIIKKAIQKDQVSMGILKSAGYSTKKILISYLSYPLLVALIAVPIGWFVGLAIQVYFTELFNTLFILPYNVLSFNIVPLFVSMVLIGGFVLITTLLTGYKLLQKDPLSLIKNDLDISLGNSHQSKNTNPQSKLGFKGRFILSLSKTNWKKIAITAGVISVATLSITATVSIPATISGMKESYFKTQKYKNYYQYQTPIPNMPLSKYGLHAWTNLTNSNDELYYPVRSIMPWPEEIIINDADDGSKLAWYNPLDYKKDGSTNNFDEIINFSGSTSETTKTKIRSEVGNYLSSQTNGPLDTNLLSWSYSWLGARGFSNALLKDLAKADNSAGKNFSTSLIEFTSTLLPSLLGVENPGVPPGPDAITEILKLTLPGFIRQVLDHEGPNAYDYFSIGHNTVAYNPLYDPEIDGAQEELVTQLQLGSSDNNLVKDFLDIAGINPDTQMLVIDSNLRRNLKYNSSDNVIPLVINQSFASKYNLSIGQTINAAPNVKTLYYRADDDSLKVLPKENWYYGTKPGDNSPDPQRSIWDTHVSCWNYRGQEQLGNTSFKDSYGYTYDGFYDSSGKPIIKDEPEPWSDVNEIWLKLPDDINSKAKNGTLRSSDKNGTFTFNTANIASSTDPNWIKPFSYQVADDYKDTPVNPTELLTTRIPEWYGAMLDQEVLVSDSSLHLNNVKDEITTKFPSWWKAIVGNSDNLLKPITEYKVIGVQDSYDTLRAYVDQKWANLIAGYSYYNERSDDKDPSYDNGTYQWFSGKLSAADNIYDVIGRMSFKRGSDDYTMYSMSSLNGNPQEPLISNSDLLTRKRDMLNKMADITFLASALFIITTVICAILIVIMITDAFLEQFRRFMSQMKAEGYTNREINSFTLGIFIPWVFFGYAVGYGLGYLFIWGFIKVITTLTSLALPFSFIWWIIPLSFGIIALIYFSTYIINTVQLNKLNLIALLQK